MQALQYVFTFNPPFDMGSIRRRVQMKKGLFDAQSGLTWKAWLLREHGVQGATEHLYAPLYCFTEDAALSDFLRGPLYKGVTDSFGWVMPSCGVVLGEAPQFSDVPPLACTRRIHPVTSHAVLTELTSAEVREAPHLLGRLMMFDVSRMQLCDYRFWSIPAGRLDAERRAGALSFEVAALSQPTRKPRA